MKNKKASRLALAAAIVLGLSAGLPPLSLASPAPWPSP